MEAKQYTEETFVKKLHAMFENKCVQKPSLLGVEFEQFLVDTESMRSYAYGEADGEEMVFNALAEKGWRKILEEEGHLLGLEKDGHTLTLEPGGQIEISLAALESFDAIDAAYQAVLSEVKGVLKPSQRLVSIGYHPKTKIDSLPLLPKQRYRYMYEYFKSRGQYCHNMMKGTASTQVSIDYSSEADYRQKNRVAQMLSPVLASLFDATPIFEGAPYEGQNCRVNIWQHTDINRSKVISGSFSESFGFDAYAAYLLSLPPVILKSEGVDYFTEGIALKDLLKMYPLTDKDIEHLTSMVFPDVRMKGFLEIRMADAMPYPYNLSVPMLIKAIFYTPELLNKYDEMARNLDENWVRKANDAILNAVSPVVGGIDFKEMKDMLFNDAFTVLTPSESRPLMMLKSVINENGSLKKWLQQLYQRDLKQFLDTVSV